jgi:hypothetical protein
MRASFRNVDSTVEVKPRRIGLGALHSKVACAVKDNSASIGPGATIIMRADAPEDEVRYALERLGFDQGTLGWGRGKTPRGEVDSVFIHTYGELARNLTENSPAAFRRFRDAFPPRTMVLEASIQGPIPSQWPARPSGPTAEIGVGVVSWHCAYSATINNDWHDDVLCSNGTETHRPYLRPEDSFVTGPEIMRSAREYERQLNSR